MEIRVFGIKYPIRSTIRPINMNIDNFGATAKVRLMACLKLTEMAPLIFLKRMKNIAIKNVKDVNSVAKIKIKAIMLIMVVL